MAVGASPITPTAIKSPPLYPPLLPWALICREGPPLNFLEIWVSLSPGHSQWPGRIMCPLHLLVEEENPLVGVLDHRTYPFQCAHHHKPFYLFLFCHMRQFRHSHFTRHWEFFSKLLRATLSVNLPIMQGLCQGIQSYVQKKHSPVNKCSHMFCPTWSITLKI